MVPDLAKNQPFYSTLCTGQSVILEGHAHYSGGGGGCRGWLYFKKSEKVVFHLMRSYLALVSATLRRLGSLRKPIPWCSLALTQDRMMKSFSLP